MDKETMSGKYRLSLGAGESKKWNSPKKSAGKRLVNILLPSCMQNCKEVCVIKTRNSVIICHSINKMLKCNVKKKRLTRDELLNLMLSSEEQMMHS